MNLHVVVRFAVMILGSALIVACGGASPSVRTVDRLATPSPIATIPESQTVTATQAPEATPTPIAIPDATATLAPTAVPTPTDVVTSPSATTVAATATPPDEVSIPDEPLVIVLDPGHDRSSPGALGIEYEVVLHTALVTKVALERAGYEVYLTREDNEFVFSDHPDLLPPNASEMHPGYGAAYAHATRALEFEPDLVLMLHYNGHPNPDVRGLEIYYCEIGGPQNLELAEILRDELIRALQSIGYDTPSTRIAEDLTVARGGRHFPSMGNVYNPPTTWIENRYAGIPVALTEPLYMTNPIERPFLDDGATHEALAEAYVRAINRYFGR